MRRSVHLSEEEVARRSPLWTSLSDLFLDTEMQEVNYCRIRDAALAGGFDAGEVKAILTDEVAPVVGSNLLVIAGEWGMFDPDWVVTRVQDYLAGRPINGMLAGPMLRIVQRMVLSEEWPRLERMLNGEPIERALALARPSPPDRTVKLFWWAGAISLIAFLTWRLLG